MISLENNSRYYVTAAAETIVIALPGVWRTRLLRTLSWANHHAGIGKDHTSSVLGAAAESQQILRQAQEGQRNDQQSHEALHRMGVTDTHTQSGYHPVRRSNKCLTSLRVASQLGINSPTWDVLQSRFVRGSLVKLKLDYWRREVDQARESIVRRGYLWLI